VVDPGDGRGCCVAIPVLAGALTMLLTDRNFRHFVLRSARWRRPDPVAALFWFFGHPRCTSMILPGFGIMSHIVSTFSRKPVFGYLGMAYAMASNRCTGLRRVAHHMYTVGWA